MPFLETYAVNLAEGNRHPHLNLRNWPDLLLPQQVPNALETSFDQVGRTLTVIRDRTATSPSANSVYLSLPPGQIPLDSRLHLRVEFDLPQAAPQAGPVIHNVEMPEVEPWAVALNISLAGDLTEVRNMVRVTCKFSRTFNGVRLNTPMQGVGGLQTDKAACLESPLNYSSYKGGYTVLPDGREFNTDPPVFTLEHSFCGWNAAVHRHAVGSGALKIARSWRPEAQDHRVFSTNALNALLHPQTAMVTSVAEPSIRALGVAVATTNGVGRMSVRLRSFSLSLNDSIEGALVEE